MDLSSFELLSGLIPFGNSCIRILIIYRMLPSALNKLKKGDFISEFASLLEIVPTLPGKLLISGALKRQYTHCYLHYGVFWHEYSHNPTYDNGNFGGKQTVILKCNSDLFWNHMWRAFKCTSSQIDWSIGNWYFLLTLTLPGPSAGVSGSLDSYCSLKPLCSGTGEVVPARTSPTLLPPSPCTVLSLSHFKVL